MTARRAFRGIASEPELCEAGNVVGLRREVAHVRSVIADRAAARRARRDAEIERERAEAARRRGAKLLLHGGHVQATQPSGARTLWARFVGMFEV
jgi:hypothetical protein